MSTFTEGDLKDLAVDVAQEQIEGTEYCVIYEDEDFEDMSEEDQLKLLRLVQSATVTLSWPE